MAATPLPRAGLSALAILAAVLSAPLLLGPGCASGSEVVSPAPDHGSVDAGWQPGHDAHHPPSSHPPGSGVNTESPSEYGGFPRAADAGPSDADPAGLADATGMDHGTVTAPNQDPLGIPWGAPTPPPANQWPSCSQTLTATENRPPEVLFLVDRSGSTSQDLGGCYSSGINETGGICTYDPPQKWPLMTSALDQVMDGMGDEINFGLMLFPATASQCTAGTLSVAPGPNTADAIKGQLSAATPGGGTPTRATLASARLVLGGAQSGGGARVVVLVTDGLPTCAPTPNDADSVEAVVAEVDELAQMGIRTYVVGVGSGVGSNPEMLSALARAGGTALPGSQAFYRADSPDDLRSALTSIAGQALRCSVELVTPPANAAALVVTVAGQPVARDTGHTDGWDYDPGSDSLVFYGDACQLLGSGGQDPAKVEVRYPCDHPQ
jgi:hypothetical protein